jgi:protease I
MVWIRRSEEKVKPTETFAATIRKVEIMALNNNSAQNKRVAILVEQGFEDSEFQVPYQALKLAGFETIVLGSRMNEDYQGKQGRITIQPDATATETSPADFDAVIIPGGAAPDKMRTNPHMVRFVQEAMAFGKIVAAVCHGPQLLIEGDLLKGKNATGFIAIRKDMENAGANYINQPLVVDGNLLTSRQPGDLAIFATAILSRLGYGGKEVQLPAEDDPNAEWWKIADSWGGSTKGEIASALNTALAGERYAHEAFEQYAEKTSDAEFRNVLQEIIRNKQQHIQRLEGRLNAIGEKPSLPAKAAEPFAKLKAAMQGSDDLDLMRRALGDIQTGVVDTFSLGNSITDPVSVSLLRDIEQDLAKCEAYLAKFYRARFGALSAKPAKPTTGSAV